MSYTIHNPILPGFHPDPSICRVGEDFYLITSSFSFYPGIPIFHSRDLANWEQIGHVLDRPEQLPLDYRFVSGGIFAPTIRYHDGTFYVITTNVSYGGNFIVTAKDPAGSWSDPHWIEGAVGIDSSLFWDEDGRAYYTGTGNTGPNGEHMIWLSEIDLENFSFVGEKINLWGGSLAKALWPEGPHLYKKDGWYYLMIAEGGTEHYHSETIARSRALLGPYESFPGNPILTQRHLGMMADIVNAGHGDLVEVNGSWYMVFLASRPFGGYHKNLGRETFIAPVIWEDDWPVVSPGTGRVLFSYPGPELKEQPYASLSSRDEFEADTLAYCWNTLGTPDEKTYRLQDGCLQIRFTKKPFGLPEEGMQMFFGNDPYEPEAAGFVGRRQENISFEAKAKLSFTMRKSQSAGLCIVQNDYHQIRIEAAINQEDQKVLRIVRGFRSLGISLSHKEEKAPYREEILFELPWTKEDVILILRANGQRFTLAAQGTDGSEIILSDSVDGSFLGSETSGGFVGTYVGLFASGNGTDYNEYASFDWFEYQGIN